VGRPRAPVCVQHRRSPLRRPSLAAQVGALIVSAAAAAPPDPAPAVSFRERRV